MTVSEKLAARALPSLMTLSSGKPVQTAADWRVRREEILDLLRREEYGYSPEAPACVRAKVDSEERVFCGQTDERHITLSFDTPKGEFSFPIKLYTPRVDGKVPVFVYIAFGPEMDTSLSLPVQEITDNGFALALFHYETVTSDSGAFDGLARCYPRDEKTGWGTLGMWAFAASRVLDYLETRPDIDAKRACVCGHSRLGKTALWCGAQDERFAMVVSNDSGCSGAAISRGKQGESINRISHVFPFWFCGNYQAWSNREAEAPFDQHMLLSLIAPRRLYVNSAEEDLWADPESEYLSCAAAAEAWTLLGETGLIAKNDELPALNEPLHDGSIGYHVRPGIHFYGRTDWLFQMEFFKKMP